MHPRHHHSVPQLISLTVKYSLPWQQNYTGQWKNVPYIGASKKNMAFAISSGKLLLLGIRVRLQIQYGMGGGMYPSLHVESK